MYIDKKSPIPAYYQLKNIILNKIKNGDFSVDRPIPSERELSEILNISRMTVRQALNQLVTEDVLYREKGKGTFISKIKIEQRNIMSFSDIVAKKGLVPVTRILFFSKVEVEQDIKEILEIRDSEPVYDIKRLRLAEDTPVGIEEVFLPEKYCPGLEKYDLTASLYKLMREGYSYIISYIDYVIEAVRPSREEKSLLDISGNIPLLKTSGINYTQSGLKLFYERSAYRSDEYKYNVRVHVNKDMY